MEDKKGEYTNKKEKSAFNAAIAQLVRLHRIKQDIVDNRREGSTQSWITNLFCFQEELYPCMDQEERKQCREYESKLNKIEKCVAGRLTPNVDIQDVISFQRRLYIIEERLGLSHQSKEDEWADDEDW